MCTLYSVDIKKNYFVILTYLFIQNRKETIPYFPVRVILILLGDSLHQCFGDELGVKQEKTEDSKGLTKMVAEEVAKNVNAYFGNFTQSTLLSPPAKDLKISHLAKILRSCVMKNPLSTSPDTPIGTPTPLDANKERRVFCQVFLFKLVDHIAYSAKATLSNMDVNVMYENLLSIMLENNFSCPMVVGNLHLTIYKKLRRQFGSANKLYAVILCENMTFLKAVARELLSELQKATRKPVSFAAKLKRFFKREIHSQVANTESMICDCACVAVRIVKAIVK